MHADDRASRQARLLRHTQALAQLQPTPRRFCAQLAAALLAKATAHMHPA